MPCVLIVAGPTAVGKTSVAIELAEKFGTEIISADSRQCYRELKIGVARPSEEELASVKHHFIASHSIHDRVTAADFTTYALDACKEIFRKNDVAVMVGGTGLYIEAFCEGLDVVPEIPETIRQSVRNSYETNGLQWLQETLQKEDPQFFQGAEQQNPHRLLRALEVVRATGKSFLDFRKGEKSIRDFNILRMALEMPRESLTTRINQRVDGMMEAGLLEEARRLQPYRHLPALQTVGYAELFDHFEGKTSLEEAITLVKVHTRQYAKRQVTWFKKGGKYTWLPPHPEAVISYAKNYADCTGKHG
jgi:tRNA dimethylallyltransferase